MRRFGVLGFVSRIAVVSLFAAGLIAGGGVSPAAGQDGSGISIIDQGVVSEFPTGLRFRLSAEIDQEVSRADLLFATGSNPTLNQSTVRFSPTAHPEIEYSVDMQNLGIPPGLMLSYFWKLHTADGDTLETPPQEVEWFDNRFDWTAYPSSDVMLYSYSGDDDFNERAVAAAQEMVDVAQARFHAPERSEPIRVWLYQSQSDLTGALSPNSRDWIGGASYSRYALIAATAASGDERGMLRVVPHEIVHQIFYDATRNPFISPAAWLDEGLATSMQPVGTENYDEIMQEAFSDGSVPSLRSLISIWGADRLSAHVSYASSYSVVLFIQATMGEDAILAMTEAYRQGLSHEDVMMQSLGMTMDELDLQWRTYLDQTVNS